MQDRYHETVRFLNACENLATCSYSAAEKMISEVLRSIAESRMIADTFKAKLMKFDYAAAKKACLKSENGRGATYLPAHKQEISTFVFCILAEIDSGSIALNEFLLSNFYKDGSYTESYTLFAERMIRPFCDIMRESLLLGEQKEEEFILRRERLEIELNAVSALMEEELKRLNLLEIEDSDRGNLEIILAEIISGIERKNVSVLRALLIGYQAFVSTCGLQNDRCGEEIARIVRELNLWI